MNTGKITGPSISAPSRIERPVIIDRNELIENAYKNILVSFEPDGISKAKRVRCYTGHDALLISKAPELYAMLGELLYHIDLGSTPPVNTIIKAKKLITLLIEDN